MAVVQNKGNAFEPVDQHWHGDADEVHGGNGGGGGISEAPIDGQKYARKDASWSVVTSSGGGGAVDDDLSGAWFTGRRWYSLGTSLTYQNFYTAPLATLSGMILNNRGQNSGTLCAGGAAGGNGSIWNALTTQVPDDAEVITMETTNDWRLSCVLGTIDDAEANGQQISFYGALKAACQWVFTYRPAARFFMFTNYMDAYPSTYPNFYSKNSQNKWCWEYNDAVRRVSEIYGVPVIEVAGEAGLNYFTMQWYASDGLHLNTLGGQRFAEYAWSRIRRMGWLASRPTAPGGIVNVPVSSVSINQGSALSLAPGGQQQMSATVLPANATNKGVQWTSSDPSKVTIDGLGLATAVANGTSTITVTTIDGGKTATCVITVAAAAVTGVDVTPPTASIAPGGTQQLTATVTPTNASNKTVTWQTDNAAVATVNSTGLVTAVAVGSATITVTTQEGGFTDTCATTIAIVAVTGVDLAPATVNVSVSSTTQLTATVAPPTATNKNVSYGSSNNAIATVNSSGLVTGVAVGAADITVTTADGGFTDSTTVSVLAAEWALAPQTVFRQNYVTGLTATGSNPTYVDCPGPNYGALWLNTAGHNAIEFTIPDGSKGMHLLLGSSTGISGDWISLGDTDPTFNDFSTRASFGAGAYFGMAAPIPVADAAGWATGTVYRVGRVGNRVVIVRVTGGSVITPIWDGDLDTNWGGAHIPRYAEINLGVLAYGAPASIFGLPTNCRTGTWTPP